MRIARTRGQQFNPTTLELGFVLFRAVSTVTLHDGWALDGAAQAALHWHNRIDQWHQLRNIVTVGPGEDGCQRQAVGVGDQMVF